VKKTKPFFTLIFTIIFVKLVTLVFRIENLLSSTGRKPGKLLLVFNFKFEVGIFFVIHYFLSFEFGGTFNVV